MPTSTLTPGDERQDEKLNPAHNDYDRRFNSANSLSDAEKNSSSNNQSSKDNQQDDIRNKESEGSLDQNGWQNNYSGKNNSKTTSKTKFKRLKKSGPLIGIGGGIGIFGIVATIFMGSASMPVSIMENLISNNDASSTSMSSRASKVLFNAMKTQPLECTSNKMKCKMGKISNSALKKLEKKGFVPRYDDNSSVKNFGKRTGYPSKNPDFYEVEVDGKKVQVRAGQDFRDFLTKNPRYAAKVLGKGGAFNLRVTAWTNKNIVNKLFKKFNLKRNGGLLDGKDTPKDSKGNKSSKLADKIPKLNGVKGAADGAKAKVEKHLNKSKKGGVAYTTAVSGCLAVKVPGFLAAGVAAVQLMQILPIVQDVILSPASKIKASGVDLSSSLSSDEVSNMMDELTVKTKDKKTGKRLSALDSPILLSALGINKNKTGVSKDYTPGYAFLSNSIVKLAVEADKATEQSCNTIMSPAAMYSAMAIETTAAMVSASTGVGLIVPLLKLAGGFVLPKIASAILSDSIEKMAKDVLLKIAENDLVPTARGIELGNVLGISALAFFSSGAMANFLPTLKVSQLVSYAELQRENEEFQRQMDIASLSPFDTSSKYTFMGSIVNNFALAAIKSNSFSNGPLGFLSALANMPSILSSNTAQASVNHLENQCGYAKEFGLEAENSNDSPAINAAGLPCTGLTTSQSSISTERAIELIREEGWFEDDDENIDIPDNASITELLDSGYIKKDTPLSDFIETCTSADTGDYIFNSGSCTTVSRAGSMTNTGTVECFESDTEKNEDGTAVSICPSDSDSDLKDNIDSAKDLKNPLSLEAISVFLLDYTILQSLNGEDDTSEQDSTTSSEPTTPNKPVSANDPDLYKDSTNVACDPNTIDAGTDMGYRYGNAVKIRLCYLPNTKSQSNSSRMARVNSRISGNAYNMLEAMKKELQVDKITYNDSYRTMEEQTAARKKYGGQAAKPGYSNHQLGLALDLNMGAANRGNASGYKKCTNNKYTSSKPWIWLRDNASNYTFSQYVDEGWHWEVTNTPPPSTC